ncbi:MAG TPA: hypothetical protein PLQ35_15155 [bacterium]|nr:hypothetical protein [bacterium]HQL63621.1 hypothetical protein [bacterium]
MKSDPEIIGAGENDTKSGEGIPDVTDESIGIIRELGDLPPGAIISENKLAEIFHRCPTSIKRAVRRGELPPSTRLFGQPVWTVESILKHLQDRLTGARKEAEQAAKKFLELRP